MMSMTMEQVLHKRHKLVKDMGEGMVLEARAELMGSGLETQLVEKLKLQLDRHVLDVAPQVFNNDEDLGEAMDKALKLKREAIGMAPLKELLKLKPAALVAKAEFVIGRLEHSEERVRLAALEAMALLRPADLAEHAAVFATKLEDSNSAVRMAAANVMTRLDPVVLAAHVDTMRKVAKEDKYRAPEAGGMAQVAGRLNKALGATHVDEATALQALEELKNFESPDKETLKKTRAPLPSPVVVLAPPPCIPDRVSPPLPSADLRNLFNVSTRREALPELIVVQIQNLEAKWDLEG